MTRVAISGRSGFLGSAAATALHGAGCETVAVSAPRLRAEPRSVIATADDWCRTESVVADEIVERLAGCDALVIASGLAAAASSDTPRLFGANAASPLVLCMLADRAGIARVVHVSSAAVQGRRDPLDETVEVEPFSPYSASKAAGEAAVRAQCASDGVELLVYRPTSVQGRTRAVTRQLVRLASLPVRPSPGGAPVPLALVENCAAAIVHLATCADARPGVYLHPWEGLTSGSVFDVLGGRRRRLPLPAALVRAVAPSLARRGRARPAVGARARQLESLFLGQRQVATALSASGFNLPTGADGYARLAAKIRRADGVGVSP
jgi:nucleoside-diphosphate-sugar epimerase